MAEKTIESNDEFPNWENMPEPEALLTLSWEDIYDIAKNISQDRLQRDPTQEDIKKIFNIICQKGMNAESETFWSIIDIRCGFYYDELKALKQ